MFQTNGKLWCAIKIIIGLLCIWREVHALITLFVTIGFIPYVNIIFCVFYLTGMYNLIFFESDHNDIVRKLDIGSDSGTIWD